MQESGYYIHQVATTPNERHFCSVCAGCAIRQLFAIDTLAITSFYRANTSVLMLYLLARYADGQKMI